MEYRPIVRYQKANNNRILGIIGTLIIGSISYSPVVKCWYLKLFNISDETYELTSEEKCKNMLQLKGLYGSLTTAEAYALYQKEKEK